MARPASRPVPQTRVLALTKTTVASPEALQATSSSNNVPWQCNICSPRPEEAEDRGLALTARRAQIGDGANARVHFSYELRRPLLAPDTEGSPALRELLALNTDTVTAFSNDTCVAYVSRVLEDLSRNCSPCRKSERPCEPACSISHPLKRAPWWRHGGRCLVGTRP